MIPFLVCCYIFLMGSVQGDVIYDLTKALEQTNAKISVVTKNSERMETVIEKRRIECSAKIISSAGLEIIGNLFFRAQIRELVNLEKKLRENKILQEKHQMTIDDFEVNIQKIDLAAIVVKLDSETYEARRLTGVQKKCFTLENMINPEEELLVPKQTRIHNNHTDTTRLIVLQNQLRFAENTLFEKENRAKELIMKMEVEEESCQKRVKDLKTEIIKLNNDLAKAVNSVKTLQEKLKKEENKTKHLTKRIEELVTIMKTKLKAAREVEKVSKEHQYEKDKICYERLETQVIKKCWKYE